MYNRIRLLGTAAALSATIGVTGCDNWMDVLNPELIDATTIDPVQDAPTFAQSAMNNLFDAFDDAIVYGGWFSGEIWEGDTFPTRTDIGRRNIDAGPDGSLNVTLNDDIYEPLAIAIATGEQIQELLAEVEDAASNINMARGIFASGYGILFEAEHFCTVVISTSLDNLGSPLTPLEGAAEAAERFRSAIQVAGASTDEIGPDLVNASRVGLARALLFRGEYAEAAAVAAEVPADFEFIAPKVDDLSNRAALGNTVFAFTLDRQVIVVPPYYRDLNDDRITSVLEQTAEFPLKTQDSFLDFYRQTKHTEWNASIRLASGLEARYIAAEAELKAGNPAVAAALIAERATAGGDDSVFNPSGDTLTDLLDQKARDFYLEGVHMGDWQRNPDAPYVPASGTPYYDETGGVFGTQTCMPLPDDEVLNNPSFPN
ncbi:MAG: hypothetical protein GEU90_19170 [Gemmatimonas sp.]|nr:hypothetical protein [Gemmatimonas sp.]